MLAIALVLAAVVCCALIAWWAAVRRAGRRQVGAFGRLARAQTDWWQAVRSYGSEASSFAFRLSAYGSAALSCAKALTALEREGAVEWHGPPPQPRELRPGAQRPGPPELWRRFDHAYEACYQLLHPADDCFELGQAALALAGWVQEHRPPLAGDRRGGAESGEEHAGGEAGFVHAVCAPCLAGWAAEHTFQQEGALRIDGAALGRKVDEDGSDAQRTMASLALTVAGRPSEGPSVCELLSLEDTDLCHALEAVALARGLRRVYPRQRPELLWMEAALGESGAQARAAESEEKGAGG